MYNDCNITICYCSWRRRRISKLNRASCGRRKRFVTARLRNQKCFFAPFAAFPWTPRRMSLTSLAISGIERCFEVTWWVSDFFRSYILLTDFTRYIYPQRNMHLFSSHSADCLFPECPAVLWTRWTKHDHSCVLRIIFREAAVRRVQHFSGRKLHRMHTASNHLNDLWPTSKFFFNWKIFSLILIRTKFCHEMSLWNPEGHSLKRLGWEEITRLNPKHDLPNHVDLIGNFPGCGVRTLPARGSDHAVTIQFPHQINVIWCAMFRVRTRDFFSTKAFQTQPFGIS